MAESFSVVNDWGAGFQGQIAIENESAATLDGWRVGFTADFEITDLWGARIVERAGNRYVVESMPWNSMLAPGGSLSFGFIGSGSAILSDLTLETEDGSEEPAPVPVVSLSDVVATEDAGVVEMPVVLDRPAGADVTLRVELLIGSAGADDLQLVSTAVTIPAGQAAGEIALRIADDALVEGAEAADVRVVSVEGARIGDATARVEIRDDDRPLPVVSVAPSATVMEGDPATQGDGEIAPGWLSTRGASIVDATGATVELTGVNWFGGETTRTAPDGLFARNWRDMMDQMEAQGFNVIRLPFSNDALRPGASPGSIDYGLNPDLAGLTPLEIVDRIVAYAGEIGLRIILDNHRNAAGDGASANGLWYGEGTSEAQWIADWEMLAERYADDPTVAGFDLSNEPHAASWGTGDPATDWRLGAEKAIAAIHAINPEVLVLVEGVGGDYWWGGNLKGVASDPIRLTETDKLVYSPHAYPNSIYGQPWFYDPAYPENLPEVWDRNWGYIAKEGIAPVLVGEFGSRLQDPLDVAWFDEFVPYLAENGLSWTYWSWNPNSGDTGGILADDWSTVLTDKVARLGPALGAAPGTDGTTTLALDVTLSDPAADPVSVSWQTVADTATANSDYLSNGGTLTFRPGETTKTVRVTVLGDDLPEEDETFGIVLSGPGGAELGVDEARLTILDDDTAAPAPPPALVLGGVTADEGAGPIEVEIALAEPFGETLSYDLSISPETATLADVSLQSEPVVFGPGEVKRIVSLGIVDDDLVEGEESLSVVLTPSAGQAGSPASFRLTIRDDDSAPEEPPASGDANGDGLYAETTVRDKWNAGFVADGFIYNDSASAVQGWRVEISGVEDIVNIWNASIETRTADSFIITNMPYNSDIAPESELCWGFQATGSPDFQISDVF